MPINIIIIKNIYITCSISIFCWTGPRVVAYIRNALLSMLDRAALNVNNQLYPGVTKHKSTIKKDHILHFMSMVIWWSITIDHRSDWS